MARISVPYFTERRGARGGVRYFWQPNTALRLAGWKLERLPADEGKAIEKARAINVILATLRAQTGQTYPAPPEAHAAPGPHIQPGTVRDLIQRYRSSRFYLEKAEKTQKEYSACLRVIEAWAGDDPVTELDEEDVQVLYDSLRKKTPAKANAVLRVLRLLWSCAVRFQMASRNIGARPGMVSSPKSAAIWPEAAVTLFAEIADAMDRHSLGTAVILNEWLGQRPSDIIGLTRGQYVAGGFTIRQGKTGATVRIPHSPTVATRLEAELAQQRQRGIQSLPTAPLLVCERTGKPYTIFRFDQDFAEVRTAMAARHPVWTLDDGQEVKTTDLQFRHLRHTAITRLFECGCEIGEIAAISGHTLGSVTQIIEHYRLRTTQAAKSATQKRLAKRENLG